MNPDVADAVVSLERGGTLSPEQARLFGRVARRELVSVHAELRLLAYAGVLLAIAGVGLLVRQHLERIGPLAITLALALAAAGCLAWVQRRAPAFTWSEVKDPHLALDDYVLLLGALIAGADLAYAEAQFTPLGEAWPWHLLIVSLFYTLLAVRFDSRVLLSLALSTFAAWRGVSAGRLQGAFWSDSELAVRANAAVCGVLFLALGTWLRRSGRKAHFEPVLAHAGWLLLLGAVAAGLGDGIWPSAFLLIALGVALAVVAYRPRRRFSLMAIAIAAVYVGVSAIVVETIDEELFVFSWFSITPLLLIAVLFLAHRRLREPE